MKVRDGMTTVVLSVGPTHTLREAARLMSGQQVGAAVVVDPSHPAIGILTERDILDSVGAARIRTPKSWRTTGQLTSSSPRPTGLSSRRQRRCRPGASGTSS